jgi:hypothetical protein
VDEGVLFEAEGDAEVVVVGAGEVDADGGHWHWFLRLGQAELHHEPAYREEYLTSFGFVSTSEMWY